MDNGKILDIVLLINGFPVAIDELKTPVRNAISWLDGAQDIAGYEKSIPEMFVLTFSTLHQKVNATDTVL